MKRLLLIAALAAAPAMADSWVMNNNGGGQIVLTDRGCPGYKKLLEAYTYTGNAYIEGCWTVIDNKVHVIWNGKDRRVYDLSDFTPNTTNKKGSSL